MFGLRWPTITMLLLATGSVLLVIDRVLEGSHDDAVVSSGKSPTSLSQGTSVDQPYEASSEITTAESNNEEQAFPIFRASPAFLKQDAKHPQNYLQRLVTIKGGRLSVQAYNAPLNALLAQISDQSGIAIHMHEAGKQTISIAFEDLWLDEGLRRILKHQDLFFYYGARQSNRTPSALWVYPAGKGDRIVPAPPEAWASTRAFEQDLSTNPDWGARSQAIETIVERKGNQAVDDVLYALSDPNPNVRYSALSSALNISLALPAGTLANLAQSDASHFVRALALQAMSEASGADKWQVRSMAQAALSDPHPHVQAQAKDILAIQKQAPQRLKRAWR